MESLNCCRCCLGVASLNPIFDIPEKCLEYSKVISVTAGIKVEVNDSLPQVMCAECIKFINGSIRFRQQCKTNQNILMNRIENVKPHDIKKEPSFILKCEIEIESVSIDLSYINDTPGSDEQNIFEEHNFEVPIEEHIEVPIAEPGPEQRVQQDSLNITKVASEIPEKSSLDPVLDKRKVRKNTRDCKSKTTTTRTTKRGIQKRTKKVKNIKNNDVENDKPTEEAGSTTESGKETNTDAADSATGPMECKICFKLLSNKLSLRNHYKIHTGFNVVCEHCGKKFIDRRMLLMHCRAKHGYEKVDKCSYCDYRAANAEQVKIHERLHTGERPFKCTQCPASFMRQSGYLQHKATHLPEKNVQCDLCPARFKSFTLMRIHLNRHRQPQYSFKCYVCQSTFARRRNVVRHLHRIHGMADVETQEIEKVKVT